MKEIVGAEASVLPCLLVEGLQSVNVSFKVADRMCQPRNVDWHYRVNVGQSPSHFSDFFEDYMMLASELT
jgi:hypothetical protein